MRSRNVRVGLFVSLALAILMAGTFLIGQERRLWERKVDYEIRFQRTNGLRGGAPVSLSGVEIGSVSEVTFPEDPGASYIAVRIRVSDAASTRIRASSVARILTQGVLGDKYVEVTPGSALAPALEPGSIIPAEDPIDYEKLLGEGGDIITNIVEASNSLKNVFGAIDRGEGLLGRMLRDQEGAAAIVEDIEETVQHLSETTGSLQRVAAGLEEGKGAFGVLLRRGEELERALARLDRATGALDRLATRLEAARGAVPRLLEDEAYADQLLTDVRETARNLAEITGKTRRGEGSLGRLVNDPTLYDNANAFVDDARSSWIFSIYRGIRGLFPPYRSGAVPAESSVEESQPRASPTPAHGAQWWSSG